MSVRSIAATVLALGALAAVVTSVASCFRKSDLAKAYAPYNAAVEKLLDAETATGKRLEELLRSQYEDEPDYPRYAEFVKGTAAPFYERFVAQVKDLAPGDPGLAAAQTQLLKFAQARADFARVLAANLDALRHSETTRALTEKVNAAENAKAAYADTLHGPAESPDTRFAELAELAKDFQATCFEPMARGKATGKDVEEHVRSRILPRVKKMRESKFEDDESSQRLRDAVAATQEFYEAVIADLPAMEARARLKSASETADQAAGDALKKFKEEIAAVRRLM
jgi:hypothetical protein